MRDASPQDHGRRIRPGQIVILSLSARMSALPERAEVIVQDKSEKWNRRKPSMEDTDWRQYAVFAKINDEATAAVLGIVWVPESRQGWLGFRDVRVVVYPPQSASQP